MQARLLITTFSTRKVRLPAILLVFISGFLRKAAFDSELRYRCATAEYDHALHGLAYSSQKMAICNSVKLRTRGILILYTMVQKEKRTYADRAEYLKKAVSDRRRKLKRMLVEYKGGKCVRCGYCKYYGALDLHHTDDKNKSFGISRGGITRSWEKMKTEADKCILLCANCHRESHGGFVSVAAVA